MNLHHLARRVKRISWDLACHMLMLAARRNRSKNLALLLRTHSVRKQWKTVVNRCKQRPSVQESTDVLELAIFADPARQEISFSHDDLAWKGNNFEKHIAQSSTEKRELRKSPMWPGAPGHPLSRQLKPSRKNSCICECIDEERKSNERIEETRVESWYPARRETLYCGLTLQNMKTLKFTASNQPKRKARK